MAVEDSAASCGYATRNGLKLTSVRRFEQDLWLVAAG
jgi:hypothetical protein